MNTSSCRKSLSVKTQQKVVPKRVAMLRKKAGEETDFAAMRKQAEEFIKALCKGGYRAEAVGILDSFGAKKLGEVEDKDLAGLIAKAEKALEG
ncbi:hypothetical protein LNQ52_20005 [Klebsiella pneumoniae subsp. pneumoniae]|nr:hypothetical protein [Klebsiella pneumoniae subsp. pneumoniae]